MHGLRPGAAAATCKLAAMNGTRLRALGCAAAIVASVAGPRAAAASPLELFGFGGSSPAMAGTGVATATGFDAVYLNPAGLADTTKRVTLGLLYGDFALEMDGEPTGTEPAKGVLIGGALPVPLGGAAKDRVGLALGFYVPTVAINRARHPLPGVPTFALLESRSHVIAIQVALGVRLSKRRDAGLRVGAGIIALAELRGGIDVTTDASGRFTSFSEQQLITQFAPIIGARYLMPAQRLDLGLTFRGTSRSDYDITVTNDLAESLPLTIPTIRIAGTAQYDPMTIAAEAAWRVVPSLELRGQLAYQRWSAFPLPTLNPIAGQPPQEPPGFHDTVVPRLGVEWRAQLGATAMAVRGGYMAVMSPAPEASGRQSLLDNSRDVVSFGLGVAWPGRNPVHVDVWGQAHFLNARTHQKDFEVYEDGERLPFNRLEADGQVVVGGLTVGVDL
jgi:hypothetical protein